MTNRVITYEFKTTKNLFNAYMPFIAQGGLFIPTRELFQLGDEVILDIALLDDPKRYQIKGKVAWLTPAGAQGGKPQGAGIQFLEDSQNVRGQIETHLAGMLNSPISTDTM